MQALSRRLLYARRLSTLGIGTNTLRRKAPTAFSTAPFSLPERGLQNVNENP